MRRVPRRTSGPVAGRRRAASLIAAPPRRLAAFARSHRRIGRAMLVMPVVILALAGGFLLLRNSSLVAVQRVQISGVHGPEARAIDAALSEAARGMSTLDVRPAALRAAVAPFRLVRDVTASPNFPHGLRISVIEQLPVASVTAGGQRTAVAADGVLLGPALLTNGLPSIAGGSEPAAGQRLRSPGLIAAAALLGAAPGPLAKSVVRVFTGPKGLTAAMHNGLLAYFGDASRPHAKWLALARVLADPRSAGASYVDVRVPERPAAGLGAGAVSSSTPNAPVAGPSGEQTLSPESAAAALSAALGGAGTGSAQGGREAAPLASVPSEGTSGAGAQTTSGTPAQAPAATPSEAGATSSSPGG